jgi:hypothetical protein
MRFRNLVLLGFTVVFASPLAAQDDFHGCGMAGTAKPAGIKAVNRYKNRYAAPAVPDGFYTWPLEAQE